MRIAISLFCIFVLSGCCWSGYIQPDYQYGTKSVYAPRQVAESYQPVPEGYTLVYTQLVARHGSRALSSPKYDDISLKIWQKARVLHELTPAGEKLGAEISRLIKANERLGYGQLSRLGQQEHQQMGLRMARRNKSLFDTAKTKKLPVLVEYSGQPRARASAVSFIDGLTQVEPELTPFISEPQENKAQLYFHKQNQAYQHYKKHDQQLHQAIRRLFDQPKTHRFAQTVLGRVYKPEFVDALTQGKFKFSRKGEKQARVYNEVDAVIQLFNLYLVAPGMKYEAGAVPWQFTRYFTPEETQWFSYLLDGEDFYQKGPGLATTNITYRIAKVLEDDFFHEVSLVQQGTNPYVAKLRFAHAETIIPFAAQMQLKGSTQSVVFDEGYQPANPWHGEWVSPYSANIQWDVYRNDTGVLLVRMLYNEKETAFKKTCKPMNPSSNFYYFNELTRCYHEDK